MFPPFLLDASHVPHLPCVDVLSVEPISIVHTEEHNSSLLVTENIVKNKEVFTSKVSYQETLRFYPLQAHGAGYSFSLAGCMVQGIALVVPSLIPMELSLTGVFSFHSEEQRTSRPSTLLQLSPPFPPCRSGRNTINCVH